MIQSNELSQERGMTACIHDALLLVKDNWKTVLRKTWVTALILTVFMTTTILFRLPNKSLHDWGEAAPMASWTIQTAVYAALLIASLLFTANIFHLFRKGTYGRTLLRMLWITLVMIVVSVILATLLGIGITADYQMVLRHNGQPLMVLLGAVIALALLAVLLTVIVPFLYVIPKYMTDDKARLRHLWTYFTTGLRRWGFLFILLLLSYLIAAVVCALLFLPAGILILAQTYSQLGALQGDALGTPAYFPYLVTLVIAIAVFLQNYITLTVQTVMIYAMGSIDMHQQVQQQFVYETTEDTVH